MLEKPFRGPAVEAVPPGLLFADLLLLGDVNLETNMQISAVFEILSRVHRPMAFDDERLNQDLLLRKAF